MKYSELMLLESDVIKYTLESITSTLVPDYYDTVQESSIGKMIKISKDSKVMNNYDRTLYTVTKSAIKQNDEMLNDYTRTLKYALSDIKSTQAKVYRGNIIKTVTKVIAGLSSIKAVSDIATGNKISAIIGLCVTALSVLEGRKKSKEVAIYSDIYLRDIDQLIYISDGYMQDLNRICMNDNVKNTIKKSAQKLNSYAKTLKKNSSAYEEDADKADDVRKKIGPNNKKYKWYV